MNTTRVATPNDPKLSDRGARRGTCMVGGKAAAEAGAVTCGAVRCSAWLGVAAWVESVADWRPKRWLGTGKLPPVAVTRAQMRRATPGKAKWVMDRLTKGLRLTEWNDVPGTDARCEELRRDKQMTAWVKGKLGERLR